MIDAVARAIFEALEERYFPEGDRSSWQDASEWERETHRHAARRALAVNPHAAAEALELGRI